MQVALSSRKIRFMYIYVCIYTYESPYLNLEKIPWPGIFSLFLGKIYLFKQSANDSDLAAADTGAVHMHACRCGSRALLLWQRDAV
jgi:hypothetical protein